MVNVPVPLCSHKTWPQWLTRSCAAAGPSGRAKKVRSETATHECISAPSCTHLEEHGERVEDIF